MSKTVEGEEERYFYIGSAILYTKNESGNLLKNFIDLSGQIIASARFDDQTPDVPDDYYFYHYDKRGSTTAIVMPDGSLITGYSYGEFGNLERSGDAGFLNETTFTGSVTDTSTGLQYMNARYYNPETGRFLSQDTYSGNVYEPWTQHLYAYCGNNPVNMIDPTGHRPVMGDNPKDEVWKKEGDSWKLKGSNVVLKPAVVRPPVDQGSTGSSVTITGNGNGSDLTTEDLLNAIASQTNDDGIRDVANYALNNDAYVYVGFIDRKEYLQADYYYNINQYRRGLLALGVGVVTTLVTLNPVAGLYTTYAMYKIDELANPYEGDVWEGQYYNFEIVVDYNGLHALISGTVGPYQDGNLRPFTVDDSLYTHITMTVW